MHHDAFEVLTRASELYDFTRRPDIHDLSHVGAHSRIRHLCDVVNAIDACCKLAILLAAEPHVHGSSVAFENDDAFALLLVELRKRLLGFSRKLQAHDQIQQGARLLLHEALDHLASAKAREARNQVHLVVAAPSHAR
jgi:hypothetical protein